MLDRKSRFQKDWLASNWDKFVAEGIEDASGRLITLSDALNLTTLESELIDSAFRQGAAATYDAIEVIAKSFLIYTVVDELWGYHLAAEEEAGHEIEWCNP